MNCYIEKFAKYLAAAIFVASFVTATAAESVSKQPVSAPSSIIINGGGSQPAASVYEKWGKSYTANNQDVSITYKISNVVKGIADLEENKIDFAGSEIPLKIEELKKRGLFQFPTALISFTPVANIPGVKTGELRLDDATLAGIFMGTIKKWNDPRLVELNPRLVLPNAEINTVHRNTGNTITYVLSSYLSKVNPEWAGKVGVGPTLNWPVGQEVGNGTNEDMMAYIKKTPHSIGFTMMSLVLKYELNLIKMKNRDGNFVGSNPESVMAASSSAKWTAEDGFYNILTDQPGRETWPFVMTGYATIKVKPANPQNSKALLNYFDSSLRKGQIDVFSSDLVPLPDTVTKTIRTALKQQMSGQ